MTPDVVRAVLARDGRCVVPLIDRTADLCDGRTELDHVKDQPMMGKRAPSDPAHLAAVCRHHHHDGWATSHRPEMREYLRHMTY